MALSAILLISGCGNKTKQAYAEAQQAQALLDAGDLAGAQAAINRALTLRADQVDVQLLSGRIRYARQDFQAAFDSYNLVLAIDPNNPEALQAVSQIGASMGRDAESAAATDRILANDPNNAPALLVKGVRLLNRRDFAGAQAIGDQMLRADPKSEAGVVLKSRAMFQSNNKPEALALLSDGLKRLGPTRMIVTALLENARDQGDADVMLAQFRTLAELVPNNVDLTVDEANVDYKLGRKDEARKRGWALLTQSGSDHDALDRLDDLWAEYDPAPLDRNQIATLAADGAGPARLMVARYYLVAANDARTAAELVGSMPGGEAAGLRARIAYVESGGSDAAAAETVLTADKTNCDALAVRSTDAVRRGKLGDAVNAAQEIASQCPDRDGFDLLAQAYRAKGENAGVRRAYLDGARARPLDTLPVAHYITWLIATGDADGAVDVARRLTQRAPAKVSGWQLLGATCARAQKPCADEAKAGEAAARRSLVIDLPPGERRPSPLLGNSWR